MFDLFETLQTRKQCDKMPNELGSGGAYFNLNIEDLEAGGFVSWQPVWFFRVSLRTAVAAQRTLSCNTKQSTKLSDRDTEGISPCCKM